MAVKSLLLIIVMLLCAVPIFSQVGPEGEINDGSEDLHISPDSDSDTISDDLQISSKPAARTEDFWISPCTELAMYSSSSIAYGGGIALGYGKGTSIGLRAAYFTENEYQIVTLELSFLLRFYLQGRDSLSGPFLQLMGGPVIFARDSEINVPSEYGVFSAGLSFGWRFLFGKTWFVEPALRGGFPYIAGAGVSAGMRL